MKRKGLLILFIICLMVWPLGVQADFTTDSNAIEKAAQSVLMLACSNKDGSLSTGSGFVAFNSQTLVTNCHVMDEAKEIVASDDNGNLYVIDRVYCVSEHMDIAILGFAAPTALRPLPLSNGDDLQRGQPVVTIGSPEGLKNTVSTGVVSSLAEYGGVPEIQISAPISHGSSGGALFDANGHVVGVTSSGLAEGQNLNFAVRSSVPLALYAAWKGETYTFNNWPKESPMDFNAGEKLAASAAPAAAQVQGDWLCPQCGQMNSHNFCQYCGTAKPQWQCACGQWSVSKFCGICGKNQETLLSDLNAALTLMEQGEFEKAAAALETLGDYNCGGFSSQAGINIAAEEQRRACYYQWGLQLEAAQEYAAASEKYMASGAYADAPQRILEMAYLDAEKAFKEGAYLTAAELYLALGDYKDSAEKAMESSYQTGLVLLAKGDYEAAQEIFLLMPDYKEAAEKEKDCRYHQAVKWLDEGESEKAIAAFEKLDSYKDSAEQISKAYFLIGEKLLSEGDNKGALKSFEKANGYSTSEEQIKSIHYSEGERYLSKELFSSSIGAFKKAAGFSDAESRVKEVYNRWVYWNLERNRVESALAGYKKALEDGYELDEPVIIKPLDEGEMVSTVLILLRDTGLVKSIPKKENTYKAKYQKDIEQVEESLNLKKDGLITLSEYNVLLNSIYPKKQTKKVKILPTLADLGYINLDFEDQKTYKSSYQKGVMQAEKDLDLTVDGIITPEEQQIILSQQIELPSVVQNLKASLKGSNKITLTWNDVEGIAYYVIYQNGKEIGTTTKNQFTVQIKRDTWSKLNKSRGGAEYYSFKILSCKYTVSAESFSYPLNVNINQ